MSEKLISETWLREYLDGYDAKVLEPAGLQMLNNFYTALIEAPVIDAVEVVRCGKCQYYHKPHVLCDDGTEKDYSEFPKEAFGIAGLVKGDYGINVGGKCEREKNCGYAEDKSVFRQPTDFCSRGERREDNAVD